MTPEELLNEQFKLNDKINECRKHLDISSFENPKNLTQDQKLAFRQLQQIIQYQDKWIVITHQIVSNLLQKYMVKKNE